MPDHNGFEQFVINSTSEQLHQFFLQHTFRQELQEYQHEGLPGVDVDFTDNADIVKLIFTVSCSLQQAGVVQSMCHSVLVVRVAAPEVVVTPEGMTPKLATTIRWERGVKTAEFFIFSSALGSGSSCSSLGYSFSAILW